MRREPNYLLLGATVLLIAVLFVGVLIFLAGAGSFGHSYQTVRVKFAHELPLPPLGNGSQITCGGIPVGKVTKVDLEALPTDDGHNPPDLYLVVEGKVDKAVELRTDCKLRAEAPPLGGIGTLTIVHRGYSSQKLPDKQIVEGLPPSGLTAVVGQLGDKLASELDDRNPAGLLHLVKAQLDASATGSLMAKIHGIADDLLATSTQIKQQLNPQQQGALLAQLDGAMGDIKTITGTLRNQANSQDPAALLGKLHTILSALGMASQTVSTMLQDSRVPVQASLTNVQDTTAMIKSGLMPSLMTQMDPADPASLLSKFHTAADKTNATLGNLQELTGSAKNLVVVNQDSLQQTILNLEETSDHLRAASREIRRNPWKLLYRPSSTEVKQVVVADAARSFSDAAGKLDSAFARLEAYVKTAGPNLPADDPQLKQLQQELSTALAGLTDSEKKFWDLFAAQK